jgi:regulatory protein
VPPARSPKPDARLVRNPQPGPSAPAYVAALRMLGRRELSEAQIRHRLARREYEAADIDRAVARLRDERAIDDARVAGAIARTATSVKRRGRLRVRREIEQAGISPAIARAAVDATFDDIDEDALIEAAISKRLRCGDVADESERARLYRYLIAQGFEHDRVMRHLKQRSGPA